MILIDNKYILEGDIDTQKFFKFEDVTSEIKEKQNEVDFEKEKLIKILEKEEEPKVKIGTKCFNKKGHHPECDYKYHCWKDIPNYSIFDACSRKATAEKIVDELDSYDVNDIDVDNYKTGLKKIDVTCYQENKEHLNKEELNNWLSKLQHPLYFLDYETMSTAIPIFQKTKPYQQIPFQFSLHIQNDKNSKTEHFEFLHQERNDPRKLFVENLINLCGKEGSVIVYNQTFEITRNKELARDFYEYEKEILAINDRIVDLQAPFQKKFIYNPKQQGSYSIKRVLPAFTDISYDDLEISSGSEAMVIYEDFIKGRSINDNKMFDDLLNYCKLDTYAMIVLLEKITMIQLRPKVSQKMPKTSLLTTFINTKRNR